MSKGDAGDTSHQQEHQLVGGQASLALLLRFSSLMPWRILFMWPTLVTPRSWSNHSSPSAQPPDNKRFYCERAGKPHSHGTATFRSRLSS